MIRIAALLLLASPALAGPDSFVKPPMELVEFGVICDLKPDEQREAPGTVSGVLNLVNQSAPVDVATPMVPAELGLSFGVRARLSETSPGGMYTVIVTHPPMGPNGQQVETWEADLGPGDPTLNLFTFELPYELVEGPWRFQLQMSDEVLLQQDFVVTPKGTVPAVQKTCYGSMIMS